MLSQRYQNRWKTFPRVAVQGTLQAEGTCFSPFCLYSCKDSICCYLVNGGRLPLQERGWGERAFLTQCIGLEMCAGSTAGPVVFGVFCFSRKRGDSQSAYARSCSSAMLVCAGAGRGGSPVQHISHTRKGEIYRQHHCLHGIKRRGNIKLLHFTTTQSTDGIAFPLLPKLLKRDQDEQG